MIGVDIGNTLTKIYLLDDIPVLIDTISTGSLPSALPNQSILLASVNPKATTLWLKHFNNITLITQDFPWAFNIHKKINLLTVGIDRLLSIEGLVYQKIDTALIVMLGTASVINVVIDNTFLGGAIAPGLKTMYNALITHAPVLKKFKPTHGGFIGKTSEEALYSGIYYLHALWIDRYNTLVGNIPIVYTGGNYKYLQHILPTGTYIPHLIALGMKSLERKL